MKPQEIGPGRERGETLALRGICPDFSEAGEIWREYQASRVVLLMSCNCVGLMQLADRRKLKACKPKCMW